MMDETRHDNFLRILFCPLAIIAVSILSYFVRRALTEVYSRNLDVTLGRFIKLLPILTYLVIGLLLVMLINTSVEGSDSGLLLRVIIIQLALPLVFLLTFQLQVLFVFAELNRTTPLTAVALIFVLIKHLRRKRED